MEGYNIIIDDEYYKNGYVKGRIDEYLWYALVHREEVEHGINAMDLQSGSGRVARLCVYKDIIEQGGNRYIPSTKVKRYIFANYKKEWDVLNSNHIDMVKQLVDYLNKRYSFRIIR
ncbi:MAG: hypothetical protein ACOYVK_17795 [Bacillota bacterium]